MTDFALTPIEQCGQRVLTTAQLADAYGTTTKTITDNFSNNKERYIEGKHYYCLKGDELKAFKNQPENFGLVNKRTSCIYLWTERGALLHAKSLNTDKAWEVYDFLLDTYFRVREQAPVIPYADNLLLLHQKQNELENLVHSLENLVTSFKGEYESRMEKLERRVNGDDITARDIVAFNSLLKMFASPTAKITFYTEKEPPK